MTSVILLLKARQQNVEDGRLDKINVYYGLKGEITQRKASVRGGEGKQGK